MPVANYAWSGLVDSCCIARGGRRVRWPRRCRTAKSLSGRKGALNTVFAALIVIVALYMLVRSLHLMLRHTAGRIL
jgi:uncharacterized protein